MQGYLKIFVLRELAQEELTGYDIMKSFGRRTGTKMPSPGTMYPLLNELMKKRLIAMTVKENKKFYRITSSGKKVLRMLMDERRKTLRNMLPILGRIYSAKELKGVRRALNMMSSDRQQYRDIDVLHGFRDTVFDFLTSKNYPKKRGKFRQIIVAAAKKIRGLA